MNFTAVKSLYPENKGFILNRNSIENYIFIHFLTPVTAALKGKNVNISPGGCVFYKMHSKQQFSSLGCSLLHDWFHADKSCELLMKKYGLNFEQVYYPGESDNITKIITEIELEYIKREKFYKEISDAAAEKLFAIIGRSVFDKGDKGSVDRQQKEEFIKIRSEIHLNYNFKWTIEEMAGLANLSPSRFHFLYKKIFGISPLKDLCATRLQRAEIILMRDDCTVERAAELCGYKNQYHFIRQFKKKTGITPGTYKKSKANRHLIMY